MASLRLPPPSLDACLFFSSFERVMVEIPKQIHHLHKWEFRKIWFAPVKIILTTDSLKNWEKKKLKKIGTTSILWHRSLKLEKRETGEFTATSATCFQFKKSSSGHAVQHNLCPLERCTTIWKKPLRGSVCAMLAPLLAREGLCPCGLPGCEARSCREEGWTRAGDRGRSRGKGPRQGSQIKGTWLARQGMNSTNCRRDSGCLIV